MGAGQTAAVTAEAPLRIIGLPTAWRTRSGGLIDLSVVPEGPSGPHELDPEIKRKIEDWQFWGMELVEFRKQRLLDTGGYNPAIKDVNYERALEMKRCQRDPAYFAVVWCHIYETRSEYLQNYPWYQESMQGFLPFIPFPFQVRLLHWFEARYTSKGAEGNGVVSKSRDMGATDTAMVWATCHFLFDAPFGAKCISRNEDMADSLNDMDAMLQRIASKLDQHDSNMPVPAWMLPAGWNREEHRKLGLIFRPDNRNTLKAESAAPTAGRAGRSPVAIVDEAAFIRHLKPIHAGIQLTSPHVFMVTSESVEVNDVYVAKKEELEAKNPECVFNIEYWEHLFHNNEWLEGIRERIDDDEAFAREVLRDPYAGFGGWMYPEARLLGHRDTNDDILDHPHAYLYVGIDPGLADETALHWIMHDPVCDRDTVLESLEVTGREPAEYIAAVICGAYPEDLPNYRFPPAVQALMETVRGWPEPKMIFGDPYGTRNHASNDDSWYQRMQLWWRMNNPRINPTTGKPNVYRIVTKTKDDARSYQTRRQALKRWMTTRLTFNDTPEVRRTLKAIQNSRWETSDTRRNTEQKDAKHDSLSHRRSALEYVAVNLETIDIMYQRRRAA